ncbi:cap-specific mRNA (nucleoside-2'-O-)-methyltransferase 1-like [Anopheles cruzii]|uniref:cap-specific mRNA (nucleoside-2'-O-)-methyltransferase 1-like n=1 Tax=Anopheles cruzii TaxID=68878 RepID=UPI0022EC251C|nr:cap-specific mRNA (nucleoside-2'-O-)-methyltransferase 1-like [Anopheles cruzii]
MRMSEPAEQAKPASFVPGLTADSSEEQETVSDDSQPPSTIQKTKLNSDSSFGSFSGNSLRMMRAMGYTAGSGLGKSGQGRVDLIETSSQKGRSGLGMKLDQLDTAAAHWDAKAEQLQIPETVVWLKNDSKTDEPGLSRDQLDEWHKVGPPKMTIDNEDKYCDTEVLQQVLKSKSVFDNLGNEDMRKARYRSNPFELIKSNIFINRAAVKMANMDAMFDYMFTRPTDEKNQPLVKDEACDLFYFADVCAGPGGFSEYVLWRNKWRAKGFGFTLRGANDFRLDGFTAGGPETFDPYYGPKDNGDIFDPENINGFADYVIKQTETGVHLMMADGGFSVEGHENEQETYSKQLYLCQVIVALAIVRPGGNFVVKLFDIFTPFSVGLVYLVYRCFRQICICKPNSSRPANSERYLVCKSKKPNTGTIERYLQDINRQMFEKRNASNDTLELVNEAVMRKDEAFYDYICASNNEIGRKQIIALMKIAAFCKNRDLMETRQLEVKQKCLDLWKLEDAIRKSANKGDPDQYVKKIYKNWSSLTKRMPPSEARVQMDLRASFLSARDWYFVPIANKKSKDKNVGSILLGKGGKEVYQFDAKHGTWILIKDVAIELSPATIIYGEIVRELQDEGRSQVTMHTLHIIDGLMLGGENIGHLTFRQRFERCRQFAKALNKPIRCATTNASSTSTCANSTGSLQIRAKKHYHLSEMESFFTSLEMHQLRDLTNRLGYNVRNPINQDRFYIPYGLLFLRDVKPQYSKQLSKRRNMEYYFNCNTGESKFPEQFKNLIEETQATFDETFNTRILWEWVHMYQVQPSVDEKDKKIPDVHRVDFKKFLKKAYPS